MKTNNILIFLFILSFILLPIVSFADTEGDFPKTGYVKGTSINVRAGDNVNFESLCKLKKGYPVKIIGRRYSWFKIALPKTAYSYIKSDYVDLDVEKGIGEVNALRVNLRAGPGTKFSILGQVSKPEKIVVFSEEDSWYKIEPPIGLTGWIHSSQVTFDLIAIKDKELSRKDKKQITILDENKINGRLLFEEQKPKGNLTFSTKDQ